MRWTSGTSLFMLYWPSINSYPWWSFSFHSSGLSHWDMAGWLAGGMSNSQTTKPSVYGFGLETMNIKHFSVLAITRNLNIQGLLLREKEYLRDISRTSLMCTTGSWTPPWHQTSFSLPQACHPAPSWRHPEMLSAVLLEFALLLYPPLCSRYVLCVLFAFVWLHLSVIGSCSGFLW